MDNSIIVNGSNRTTIRLGDIDVTFEASQWALMEYKRIFGVSWNDKKQEIGKKMTELASNEQVITYEEYQKISEIIASDYGALTDAEFKKLSKEKKDRFFEMIAKQSEYSDVIKKLEFDEDLNTKMVYAMAVAGGFSGTQKDLFSRLAESDFYTDSAFMKEISKLTNTYNPSVKKNIIQSQ